MKEASLATYRRIGATLMALQSRSFVALRTPYRTEMSMTTG